MTLNQLMNKLKPRREFPLGFKPYGGAQWWCLHSDCLAYIDYFVKSHKSFVRFFKTTRIPDELFFHTMVMNSYYRERIVNQKLTYVDWNGVPAPKVLDESDLDALKGLSAFFARKIDLEKTPNLINVINDSFRILS